MCGLSGAMSSSLSQQEGNIFRHLFNVSSLRGFQGSGVIVSQKDHLKASPHIRSIRTKRIAGSLAYSEALDELLKPRHNILVGHARWPTKGGIDIKAVHPHRAGHIIGVHNGTMYKVNGEAVKDRSDSEMLFQSFAENGVIETIKKSDGAYALVWIDEKDQTINFLRNGMRTLFFKNVGWNEKVSTLYWSSEREMLNFVFAREFAKSNTWDTYLPVDTWYKYPLDVKYHIQPVEVVKDVKPEPKVYPVGEHRGRGHGAGRYQYNPAVDFDPEELPWIGGQNVLQLPAPSMSKNKQKRVLKAQEREEAARLRRLEQFRRVNAKALGTEGEDISAAMSQANLDSDLPDLVVREAFGIEGHECAWCGGIASAGDTVYPVGGDAGTFKEFLCDDCSKNNDCKQWVEHQYAHTVAAKR
jgi:hypothetical protein